MSRLDWLKAMAGQHGKHATEWMGHPVQQPSTWPITAVLAWDEDNAACFAREAAHYANAYLNALTEGRTETDHAD